MVTLTQDIAARGRGLHLALVLPWALFAAALFGAAHVIYMNEDAAILFRYSMNLAETGVISYNPGGTPAEGATDFLFMVAIGGLAALGIDPYAGSLFLNACAFLIVLALLQRALFIDLWTGLAVTAVFIAMAPFSAAAAGFSVVVFCAAILACVIFALEGGVLAFAISALVCCLIRPDGFVFAAPLTARVLLQHLREPRAWLTIFAALVVPGIAYFLWRWSYFGEFLPLPFYVKAEVDRDILGLFYTGSLVYFLHMAGPILVGLVAVVAGLRNGVIAPRSFVTVLAVTFVPALCFYLSMHLIQNLGNRFLAFIPLLAVLAICNVAQGWLRLALAATLVISLIPDARTHVRYLSAASNDCHIAAELGALDGRLEMAVTEAGHLAYHSGADTLDLWGLNTREFARLPATGSDLAGRDFDLIVLHYPDAYTCEAMVARHTALRNGPVWDRAGITRRDWTEMVEGVLSGIDPARYTLYRVAVFHPADHRHFMYLVHKDRPQATEIAAILSAHSGVAC